MVDISSRRRILLIDSDLSILRGYGVPPRLMSRARYHLGQGYSHERAAELALARG